jgi:hypothetical protein
MKSKKVFGAPGEDFEDASFKGKKKFKLPPVKKQKSNRNQFLDELEEFDDDDELLVDEDLDELSDEDFDPDLNEDD